MFEKLPKLKIAFAHGGGEFPATIGRIEHGFNVRPDLCAIDNDKNTAITITIVNVDGKEVLTQQVNTFGGQEIVPFNVTSLAAGMYFVKVSTADATAVRKVMID